MDIVTNFPKNVAKVPSERFDSIVRFIASKGQFQAGVDKRGRWKVAKKSTKTFPVAYDNCDGNRWIRKNFILKNLQVATLGFRGTKKDKVTGFTPGLHFEEWVFANNADRDSAMKIVQTAYTYPNNIVMYEKRYSQFVLDDKCIFLLEAGAAFAEPYAIAYKNLIEQFLRHNHGRH